MKRRNYLQLDVFAHARGCGNPLDVVLDAEDLDATSMQAIAAWLNLSETTFVLPPTQAGADYRLRIFTPRQELPFAGHPSVGTAHAVLQRGLAEPCAGRLVQECAAGLLPLRIDASGDKRRLHVRAPRAARHEGDAAAILSSLRSAAQGALRPALIDNGPRCRRAVTSSRKGAKSVVTVSSNAPWMRPARCGSAARRRRSWRVR